MNACEETWRLSLELWRTDRKGSRWTTDYLELLRDLSAANARFLVVGAFALAIHARPRATGDLDIWVEATPENAGRVYRALRAFGAPLTDLSESDLTQLGSHLPDRDGAPPRGHPDVAHRPYLYRGLENRVSPASWASSPVTSSAAMR